MTRMQRGAALLQWRRQRQEKARRRPTLNLIALMDVFTILVFFFLVHSSDGAPAEQSGLVKLPQSYAALPPRETPVVTITLEAVLLEGEPIAELDSLLVSGTGALDDLRIALEALRPEGQLDGTGPAALTIRGDRLVPFEALYSVMRTCTRAGFGDIALSVTQLSRAGT